MSGFSPAVLQTWAWQVPAPWCWARATWEPAARPTWAKCLLQSRSPNASGMKTTDQLRSHSREVVAEQHLVSLQVCITTGLNQGNSLTHRALLSCMETTSSVSVMQCQHCGSVCCNTTWSSSTRWSCWCPGCMHAGQVHSTAGCLWHPVPPSGCQAPFLATQSLSHAPPLLKAVKDLPAEAMRTVAAAAWSSLKAVHDLGAAHVSILGGNLLLEYSPGAEGKCIVWWLIDVQRARACQSSVRSAGESRASGGEAAAVSAGTPMGGPGAKMSTLVLPKTEGLA
jgi:hypothetical protein